MNHPLFLSWPGPGNQTVDTDKSQRTLDNARGLSMTHQIIYFLYVINLWVLYSELVHVDLNVGNLR